MQKQTNSPGKYHLFLAVIFLFLTVEARGEQILMTLSVQSAQVRWQDEFILTLEIYGPPTNEPPEISIDGLDQFQLKSIGKNLLQVPLGKTAKWILTYDLTAHQDGTFKLGPASATVNGRRFLSNTLFITVEAPVGAPPPQPEKPAQPAKPAAPVIHSAEEVGDRVKVVMESSKMRLYRSEAAVVTLRLLSQLPVENLRFKEEADFPGFLKYDFPFSSNPKAQWVEQNNLKFASYELQKFLVFPMKNGSLNIPAVGCELRVRPPSGAYAAADLILNIDRSSNSLKLNVLSPPPTDLIGQFILRNEIVSDEPRSKVMRLSLEGYGQLTTFDFSPPEGRDFSARLVNSSTSSKIEGERLKSSKTAEYEIVPSGNTISVAIDQSPVKQFDPAAERVSELRLPLVHLRFAPPGLPANRPVPLPKFGDSSIFWLPSLLAFSVLLLPFAFFIRSGPRPRPPKLVRIFHKKNPSLQISKAAAQKLYRQMAVEITSKDAKAIPILEILKRHVPESEWIGVARAMRRLEATAFSPLRENALTYREMKNVCQKLERLWQM